MKEKMRLPGACFPWLVRRCPVGRLRKGLFLWCSVIPAFVLADLNAEAEVRTWTSADGRQVEGVYISADDDNLTFSVNDREMVYPIDQLSKDDQEYIGRRLEEEREEKRAALRELRGRRRNVRLTDRLFESVNHYTREREARDTVRAFESGDYWPEVNPGRLSDWYDHDQEETLHFYAPPSYDGTEPYGLLVYISSIDNGSIPGKWRKTLDEMKFIAVSADNVGNEQPVMRRIFVSMDAMATAEAMYNIDPERRILTGYSGGGSAAMLAAAVFPGYFVGALSQSSFSILPKGGSGGHFPGFNNQSLARGERKNLRWAVATGTKDGIFERAIEESERWDQTRLDYKFFPVEGLTHITLHAEALQETMEWILAHD